jgi:hypothetical protein
MRAIAFFVALVLLIAPALAESVEKPRKPSTPARPAPPAAAAKPAPEQPFTTIIGRAETGPDPRPVETPPPEPGIHYAAKRGVFGPVHELGCIPPEKIKPIYSPPDLYNASRICILEGKPENAYMLIRTGQIFVGYDTLRVPNPSAADGVRKALLAHLAEVPMEADHPLAQLFATTSRTGAIEERLCQSVRGFEKPTYYPFYLINYINKELKSPEAAVVRQDENFDLVRLINNCSGPLIR